MLVTYYGIHHDTLCDFYDTQNYNLACKGNLANKHGTVTFWHAQFGKFYLIQGNNKKISQFN